MVDGPGGSVVVEGCAARRARDATGCQCATGEDAQALVNGLETVSQVANFG